MTIESLDKWDEVAKMLLKHGYGLWQTQYDIFAPEGFIAQFGSAGYSIVEIVTHSSAVHNAIVRYGL